MSTFCTKCKYGKAYIGGPYVLYYNQINLVEFTTSDGGSLSLKLKSPSVYDEMNPTFIDLAGGVFLLWH